MAPRTPLPFVVLLAAASGAACVTRPIPNAAERTPNPHVEVDGKIVDAPAAGAAASAFRAQADGVMRQSGERSLVRLVALYPDRALEWMRALERAHGSDPLAPAIAAAYDAANGAHAAGGAASAAESRAAIERARARGLAALDADRVGDARAALEEARALAREAGQRHLAFEIGVRLGDSRLLGQPALREAIADGRGVCDPSLWRRVLDGPLGDADPQLRAELARMELRRGEAEPALLDFRVAESLAKDARVQESLRLDQARALLALARRGDALVLIGALVRSPNADVERGALALSAVIATDLDDLAGAETALESALRDDAPWPGRGRALSDLGSVRLARGDEARGLDALRRAAVAMLAEGDAAGAVRAMRTEARYLAAKNRDAESRLALERAERTARDQGIF